MDALWGYEESHEMEQLEQKLPFTTLELEKLKSEATERMRKNKDYINQLIHLLNYAIEEQNHLRNLLLNNYNITIMPPQPDHIPLFQPPVEKPNSCVTESNNIVVESLFDTVSAPDFSNVNFVLECNEVDEGTLLIDNLVKGKSLPKRGKFLQAVIEAGPLLQTILVAGLLPRWRNPPQLCEGGDVFYPKVCGSNASSLVSCGMINSTSGYNTTSPKRQRFS